MINFKIVCITGKFHREVCSFQQSSLDTVELPYFADEEFLQNMSVLFSTNVKSVMWC